MLSGREIEVLNWVKEGKTSWEIAHILGVSERTVNFHVTNIMDKLDAKNRSHAVAIAVAERLLEPLCTSIGAEKEIFSREKVMTLEKISGLEISDEELDDLRTIGDLIAYIKGRGIK